MFIGGGCGGHCRSGGGGVGSSLFKVLCHCSCCLIDLTGVGGCLAGSFGEDNRRQIVHAWCSAFDPLFYPLLDCTDVDLTPDQMY